MTRGLSYGITPWRTKPINGSQKGVPTKVNWSILERKVVQKVSLMYYILKCYCKSLLSYLTMFILSVGYIPEGTLFYKESYWKENLPPEGILFWRNLMDKGFCLLRWTTLDEDSIYLWCISYCSNGSWWMKSTFSI